MVGQKLGRGLTTPTPLMQHACLFFNSVRVAIRMFLFIDWFTLYFTPGPGFFYPNGADIAITQHREGRILSSDADETVKLEKEQVPYIYSMYIFDIC